MSRPVKVALGTSKQVTTKSESYAAACKKTHVVRINSLAEIRSPKKGLFSEEQSLPQEVSKPTGKGSPFTTRADSKERLQKLLDSNLFEKFIDFSHLHLQRMESHTKSAGNSIFSKTFGGNNQL